MKFGLSKILLLLLLIPAGLFGGNLPFVPDSGFPNITPTITGTDTACAGASGNVYITETGMTGYVWAVSPGGTITAGGNGTNSVTVTWNTPGLQTISVIYDQATTTTIMNVTVLTPVVVGITISASDNPVCEGTLVTYTATVTNGGPSPHYQWMVDGVQVGSDNPVYSFIPSNGKIITCQLTSGLLCTTGNPVVSVPIIMIVNPNLPVSISISASSNPSCEGSSVVFSATPTNGGTTPGYQWYINAVPMGTNSTYAYIPANGDIVTCLLTSNAPCASGSPAMSNSIIMTVSPLQPVSVSIVASANPSCEGDPVTFTATPVNGGISPAYEWRVNGIVVGTGAAYTFSPANDDSVVCKLTSNAGCTTGNPASSNEIIMIVIPSAPVSINITASDNPVCEGIQVTYTAIAINGGTTAVYQWKLNNFPVGTNDSLYSYLPTNGDIISCQVSSSLSCASGNPAISNSIMMTVIPTLPVSVNIIASSNPACEGTQVQFTAMVVNGGTNPVYQWKVNDLPVGINSSTYSYTPINGDIVICEITSSDPCTFGSIVTSNAINMMVSPGLPVSISIAVSSNPACSGNMVTFTSTVMNGGSTPFYDWMVNGTYVGIHSSTYSYIPTNGEIVSCKVTSSLSCATGNPAVSNAITMTISSALPVSISIAPSSNPSCQGQTVTYTATPVNGGTNPVFQWRVNTVNVGSNLQTYSYIPASGDSIKCFLTSNYPCATGNPATSNKIIMTVNQNLLASVSIISSLNPSCQGSQVTYTATAVNGGSTPAFQWKVNGLNVGPNQSTFIYFPINGDIITCQLTSSVPCPISNPVTSNPITQTVYPIVPAGITISASENPVCSNTYVTFTATPINGGTSPGYQWKLGGINVGQTNNPILTFQPINGDVVTCQMNSNLMCVSGNPVTSNPITMVVSPTLNASATITVSSNPFCQGSSVTFSATAVNGGTSPSYQWQVNGINTGTNSSSFAYSPVNGDYVTCKISSSLPCASPNPVTSNSIYMQLNTNTPAGISITASANPVCQGSPVTFTANPINGGSSPVFQWRVNGVIAGSNGTSYTYTPVNGDSVTCKLISNAPCVSGSPIISAALIMVVSTALPATVNISASSNPFCVNDTVTFIASITNGGSTPVYHWKVNGVAVGPNSSSYTYPPGDGDHVTCWLTSNATCLTGTNPVESNMITMADTSALPVSISIIASANPVCQGTTVVFSATQVNGGPGKFYQWKVNGINAGLNSPFFIYSNPVNGKIITCQLTSSLSCATGNPAISNAITMIVTPPQPVSVSIVASNNPVCVGIPETFTATPVNGGTSPVYQWRVNGLFAGTNSSVFTYTPLNGDVVTCQLTSNATCISGNPAISNPIAIIVRPEQPVSVTISASPNPFCIGQPVTFTANPVNGGTSPFYQWKVNGVTAGTNSSIFIYIPNPGDTVNCLLTSNQACICNNPALSNTIIMVASSSLPVSVTISASMNPLCAGTTVTYTATIINGGSSPNYQWKVNGLNKGTNYYKYEYAPANGDTITCQLTSNLACATGNPATSNPITMTVYPLLPVSVTITASANPTCIGNTVCFTSTVINGGTNPIYRWRKNGIVVGTNSPSYCCIPSNGDVIYCRVTSNEICYSNNPANSNSITMNVIPYGSVGVTISATPNPVCQGTPVIFTAIPQNGGTDPVYQWKVNGVNAGSDSSVYSYVPADGDVVYCEMISNAYCVVTNTATSNSIIITVSPSVPVSVSIAASATLVCQGTIVTFTATPVNGGTPPLYQWKVNGSNSGTNSPVFSYIPVDGDNVFCVMTSNASCTQGNPATSNVLTMSVSEGMPVSLSIMASSTPVCQGQTICYTAIPFNGGPNPVYQWRINGIVVGTNSPTYSFIPSSGDVVDCQLTSSYTCATGNPALSNQIVMTFFPNLPVSVSITCSANPACQGTSVTYTAVAVNGGTSPVYQWKINGVPVGSNSSTYSYIPVNGDIVTCKVTSNVPCPLNNPAISNPITMAVLVPVSATITISPSANPVCLGSPVTYTATTTNGGSSPIYHWHRNGLDAGSNPTYTCTPANGDTVTCRLTSSLTCVNNNPVISNMITMVVGSDFPVSVIISASSNPACQGQFVTFTATATNGGSSPVYQWKVKGINVGTNSPSYTYSPTNGDSVTCTVASNYSCASNNPAVSNLVIMTVNPILPVSVSISSSFNPACLGTTVAYTAVAVNGGSAPVYQWKVNGFNAGTNVPVFNYIPVNGDIITCQVTSNSTCITGNPALSNPIIMIVGTGFPVSISITASANPICVGTQVTYTATSAYGGSSPFYQWKINGSNVGINSTTYTCFPNEGDIVTCTLTSNLTCATGNPAVSNPITMTVLPVPVGISIEAAPSNNVCTGTYVTFTAIPENGGANPTYKWKVNGIDAGTNNSTFCYQPVNGDIVTCVITSNATCASGNTATSNPIIMIVTPLMPVSISITADPSGFVCSGTQVTYSAAAINGGSSPVYHWKVNGVNAGTNSMNYTYYPVDGDIITCTVTSNLLCATGNPAISNSITMTVLLVPIGISITANPTSAVCAGTNVVFTAIPLNGGPAPGYQWKVNGNIAGTNSSTFSYPPENGDVVTCILTSNATCAAGNTATSNPITVAVNPNLPVNIDITASENPVCSGTPVVFTANEINGGTSPVFQWKVNGVNVGNNIPNYSYTPLNGDNITCQLTSNAVCATGNPATSNAITIALNPTLPVSISIEANPPGSICDGTLVTFTGSAINGGSAPGYQWKVNGIDAGLNSSTFSYAPLNGDLVSCMLTSSAACATGNPAISNVIQTIVNQNLPVSIGITSDPAGAVCDGTIVTFTGVAVNGGSAPVYQWKVNDVTVGTNNPTFSYIPINGDIITCQLTSDATCTTGNPAVSNAVVMTVNPLSLVNVIVTTTPSGSVCNGTQVTYTATPFNGGSDPSFQWKVNGIDSGSNMTSFNYTPFDGDVITCVMTSNATCSTGSPASSEPIHMIVNQNLPVSIDITANPSGAICEGSTVTFTGTALNVGSAPVYQWKVNGLNAGTNSPVYSYAPVNGDIITCTVISSETCTTGSPAISNPIVMTVNPNLPVSIDITASVNPVCEGTPVIFTSSMLNGGTMPVYQWKVNGIDVGNSATYTYVPLNGDIVNCILTSNATCATGNPASSNAINIIVNPNLPVSMGISANPPGPVCEGTTVMFTGSVINGGPSPVYQWKVNGVEAGTNGSTFSYVPLNGDIINCIVTSDGICTTGNPATSNAITVTVNPNLPVSIGIAANPPGEVCDGTIVTFTGSPVNGGSSPVYQWKVNVTDAGTNSPNYSYVPLNGDIISCTLISNATCATGNPALSNSIAMTVNPNLPVSITISASANPVCEGTPVIFTASGINGGTAPVYQWKVNGTDSGTNSPSFSYIPLNGDLVTCSLTSNAPCTIGSPATSDPITITTNPNLPVSISVQANPSGPVCDGTSVTFTGSAINGGSSPVYQWKVNGVNAGTNSSVFGYIPSNGDLITCILTSDAPCATGNPANSNQVAMIVNPNLPVSILITSSINPVCEGIPVTFSSTAVNSGGAPFYQWQVNAVNAGSNQPDYIYTPSNGDVITCTLTSNAICPAGNPATSNPVMMSVAANPVVNFSNCVDPITTTSARPFKLKGGIPLGGIYSGPGINSSTGMFSPSLAGTGIHQITYKYTNTSACSDSGFTAIEVYDPLVFTCGTAFTDPRDNKEYPTLNAGTQCWFAVNLNYGQQISSSATQRDNCLVEKYCYNDLSSNCTLSGGFYHWDEMMQYNEDETGQGFCPPGWHVPDENDWNILFNYLTGSAYAGDALKTGGSSGFNSLLAGGFFKNRSWVFENIGGFFWSSTSQGPQKAWAHGLNANNHGVSFYPSSRANAYNVRCLKD
jgi:uncharacterized protein (TIGR02145 family)